MAIDIKELRIGSHILAGGARARVIDIHKKCLETENFPYQVFVEGISPEDGIKKVVGGMCDGIDPVPITPELFEELGFERFSERDETYWAKNLDNRMYLYATKKDDIYVARIKSFYYAYDIFHFKYLHELEGFVYLTTKQELIKE